ncbi:MAG: pirin family protein [Dehalococcoidia bacterium]|nr:pirin family protein [Dehalococcoidia bacterium]
MSGPVQIQDADATPEAPAVSTEPILEVTPSRAAMVDGQSVRRALPRKGRRTVGAWCFADHIGPSVVNGGPGLGIGPHPHIGLQTVTWLLAGEVLHRDSLGSEQLIRPGELNLMTAGNGVAHSEESPASASGELHGIQLWVAQPERTRHGEAAFEHHESLPQVELPGALVTVLVGEFADVASPARRDTDHVGLDVALRPGAASLPLRPDYEYAIVVLEGAVTVDSEVVTPGHLAYLGEHRASLDLGADEPTRLMLLGGVPFESPILMWWNFVGRTREEIDAATDSWEREDGRFPSFPSTLARIPAEPTPWPK